jgi:hypothetical protein
MCLNLDEVAAELYLEFAQDAKKRKLQPFGKKCRARVPTMSRLAPSC